MNMPGAPLFGGTAARAGQGNDRIRIIFVRHCLAALPPRRDFMAAENRLRAKENRRRVPAEGSVDYIFLILVLLALTVGLTMLYSASSAQSLYDTGYRSATRYLQKQA